MTFYWHEHPDSRSGSKAFLKGTDERVYIAVGTSDESTVYSEATSRLSPTTPAGYLLTDIKIDPITTGDNEDAFSWKVTGSYANPDSEEGKESQGYEYLGKIEWDFDIGSATAHTTHALHQTEYPGGAVDDAGLLKRAIEATEDGDVKGIDAPIATVKLNITKTWPRALWVGLAGMANLKTIAKMIGRPNSAPWWTFERGEVVLLGARPEHLGDYATKVSYVFDVQQNIKMLDMGIMANGLPVVIPEKRGHQYLWVYHQRMPVADPAGGEKMIPKPWLACVADLVEEVDLSILGLGNAPP